MRLSGHIEKETNVRKAMALNAMSYNKFLTTEHIEKMTINELFSNTHPGDRERFRKMQELSI